MFMNNCIITELKVRTPMGLCNWVTSVKITRFIYLLVLPHVSFHTIWSTKDKYGGKLTRHARCSHVQGSQKLCSCTLTLLNIKPASDCGGGGGGRISQN